jgi:peroxiredoxin
MTLTTELSNFYADFQSSAPSHISGPIISAKTELASTFDKSAVIKPGATLPSFSLPDARGKTITSSSLLAASPSGLLITFYRGEWCPFCNMTLKAHQAHLSTYESKGVTFVAISPEKPNNSLTLAEKASLKFPLLSDVGNRYARKLGIVFKQDESVRKPFEALEIDLDERNGDHSFELPIPVTLLVGKDGVVRNIYVEPDFVKRLDPEEAVKWIDELDKEGK